MKEKTAAAVLVKAGSPNDARRRSKVNRHSGTSVYIRHSPIVTPAIARDAIWYYLMLRRAW